MTIPAGIGCDEVLNAVVVNSVRGLYGLGEVGRYGDVTWLKFVIMMLHQKRASNPGSSGHDGTYQIR